MPNNRTIPRICQQCGTDFPAYLSKVKEGKALYCSKTCHIASQHGARPALAGRSPILSPDGLTARIPLGRPKNGVQSYAVIDAADALWVGQWNWHLDPNGYAFRQEFRDGRYRRIVLHRVLLSLTPDDGLEGDHQDRDRLNNQRSNLRAVPKVGNRQNVSAQPGTSSIYRGVTRNNRTGKWMAQVKASGKHHCLGTYTDEAEAAEAARAGRRRLLPYSLD